MLKTKSSFSDNCNDAGSVIVAKDDLCCMECMDLLLFYMYVLVSVCVYM